MVGTAGSSSDHLHVKCTQASISLTVDEKEGDVSVGMGFSIFFCCLYKPERFSWRTAGGSVRPVSAYAHVN